MTEPVVSLDGVTKNYKLYSSPQDRLKEALHPFHKIYHNNFTASDARTLRVRKRSARSQRCASAAYTQGCESAIRAIS